jgi:glycosyltransferase involved in cell wall biosynthesis
MIITPDTHSSQVYQPFTNRAIRVLNYGIPDPSAGRERRAPREIEKMRFLLLGTIEHRKGQQMFLNALRQLPAEVLQHAHFQIVGRAHDMELTAEIKAAAKGCDYLSYEESVPHEQALALISDADVMVSASWDETGPLILIEALALGKPILSTSVGAVAENLIGEEAGLFFPPGDATALAQAMQRLVEEPELVDRLGARSRQAYEKYFGFDRFC